MTNNKATALITGGSKGLGVMSAHLLAKQGINLALNYHNNQESAERLKKELEKTYTIQVLTVQGNVGLWNSAQEIVQQTLAYFGRVDILLHNAGPYIFAKKRMIDYSLEEWERVINGNLSSFFYLTKCVIPIMRERKWGRIIAMGFDRAQTAPPWPFRSVYAAAKVGLVSLTKTLALEEAKYGITVNMVCPGDIIDPYKEKTIAEVVGIKDENVPVGRPGTGEDIARVIKFLVAHESDFLTGNVFEITGGKDVLGKHRREL